MKTETQGDFKLHTKVKKLYIEKVFIKIPFTQHVMKSFSPAAHVVGKATCIIHDKVEQLMLLLEYTSVKCALTPQTSTAALEEVRDKERASISECLV